MAHPVGRLDAIEHLREAIDTWEGCRSAKEDPDFDAIREEPTFRKVDRRLPMSEPAAEQPIRLSVPVDGIGAGDVILRFPSLGDVDALLPAFEDPELRDAGNLPSFDRAGLAASIGDLPMLADRGRLLALAAVDARSGELVGAGMLHHLDSERKIVEIGYFVLPHARRRGFATTIARVLSEHAFSMGIERVAAYVNVGNIASERVVEHAGFTREGVVRSMPKPDGRRVDKTLFSLLPGE
jgi:RimJ/RimL family protein N-acetyltransferase